LFSGETAEPDDQLPAPIQLKADDPIGKFLADADNIIARWNFVKLQSATPAQQREVRRLDQLLRDQTRRRAAELIVELESGPPVNRQRAAAALGFSGAIEAQSPLLNALSDLHPDVVHNALIGLALLGRADTPLEPIGRLCEFDPDPQTRSQAAFALREIVNAGASGDTARGAARRGLIDQEPFVRSQCALTLGLLGDRESLPALCDVIYDSSVHVASAGIQALVLLVDRQPDERGRVARALVDAHSKSKDPVKDLTMQGLVQISEVNYGGDMKLWSEWAAKLP
jgi:HEAT repeat protein